MRDNRTADPAQKSSFVCSPLYSCTVTGFSLARIMIWFPNAVCRPYLSFAVSSGYGITGMNSMFDCGQIDDGIGHFNAYEMRLTVRSINFCQGLAPTLSS